MTAQPGQEDERRVVPRWRSFADTLRVGELRPLQQHVGEPDGEIERAFARARRTPSTYQSAELLSTLMARGQFESAGTLAVSLSDSVPTTLRTYAERIQSDQGERSVAVPEGDNSFHPSTFAIALASTARRRLRTRSNNSVAWVDLALAHTILGHTDRAKREIRSALQFAPDNRFVLRAAARLFVHLDDPAQANRILSSSTRLQYDPWLMAAELSTAQIAFGKAPNTLRARAMVEQSGFSPRATSELVSELATDEIQSGRDRKARALFRQSFVDPTENAVAQAVSWADRSNLELGPELLKIERGFEGRAIENARSGAWSDATDEAGAWHRDQPFSIEPYRLASYTAAFGLEDYERGSQIAILGLQLHKGDRTLSNNAAFALASLGRTSEARTYIAIPEQFESVDDLVEIATVGLIHFRELDVAGGRALYQAAIMGFQRLKRFDLAALATAHWATEETRLSLSTAPRLVKRAQKLLTAIPPAERSTMEARLEATRSKEG